MQARGSTFFFTSFLISNSFSHWLELYSFGAREYLRIFQYTSALTCEINVEQCTLSQDGLSQQGKVSCLSWHDIGACQCAIRRKRRLKKNTTLWVKRSEKASKLIFRTIRDTNCRQILVLVFKTFWTANWMPTYVWTWRYFPQNWAKTERGSRLTSLGLTRRLLEAVAGIRVDVTKRIFNLKRIYDFSETIQYLTVGHNVTD